MTFQDCGLIHDDGPESQHVFTYAQVVRTPLGVEITVTLLRGAGRGA